MEFLADYGLFLLKILTVVVAILVVASGLVAISLKGKSKDKKKIKITHLNKKLAETTRHLQEEILSKADLKKISKAEKKAKKAQKEEKNRLFVLRFNGDIRASGVESLRREITGILTVADKKNDEVLLIMDSGGGIVNGYGLCASQLARIRDHGIKLTIAIDKVAASGGYMMACVADKVLAAPFAIIGSIGVIAQLPNFYRFLKDKNVDIEQHTAGQFKRTLTLFGENTPEGRHKLQEELEETHELFKQFITRFRPQVDLSKVATGEHWYAEQAIGLQLVDELSTSDDYLLKQAKQRQIYQVACETKKSMLQKMMGQAEQALAWLRAAQY